MLMLWEVCALPWVEWGSEHVQVADLMNHGLAMPVASVPCIYFVLSMSVLSE